MLIYVVCHLPALAMGQMVHPMTFTLMDSMTCISILDPRMDSGIYPTPEHLIPESDRLSRDSLPAFDPQRALTVSDVVWIMDRLTACEVRQPSPLPGLPPPLLNTEHLVISSLSGRLP